METSPAKPRELYAEILRIVAAFSVVFQHTVTSAWYDTSVRTGEWLTLNFYNSIARFGVGVFIMISGAFMLSPRYAHPPEKVLGKNLPRILLLLVFWVVVYGSVDTIIAGGTVKDIFATPFLLFTKPPTHLWFLYTIAGLYVLTPAIRVFTEHASHRMVLYVIGIFFCFGLVLPMVNHLLERLADVTLYKNIRIQGCTTFAGFYLTGFYLSHYGLKPLARKILYLAAIASWAIAFLSSTYFSIDRSKPNEYFLGNFRPTTFLIAAAIFCLFCERYRGITTTNRRLTFISACMLGVYLIHPLFIKLFYGLKLSLLTPHPIIVVPVAATAIFAISLLVTSFFRPFALFKKFF
jgi:surface polysaccharide O-acyltransferase-like enzyme